MFNISHSLSRFDIAGNQEALAHSCLSSRPRQPRDQECENSAHADPRHEVVDISFSSSAKNHSPRVKRTCGLFGQHQLAMKARQHRCGAIHFATGADDFFNFRMQK
ncbi:hypothetical protein FHS54_000657 [Sphingobium vermicomposti]|uniref:Uncharacterized protein n=1 Tax=Sphingobium vermicomposti TaxID=529005 RepID=A0A846M3P1_9SPHN|nr:hypothetical protein [Sphingobium vermicomposti]